jgi:hypothetical protein
MVLTEHFIPPKLNTEDDNKKKKKKKRKKGKFSKTLAKKCELEMPLMKTLNIQPGEMPEVVQEKVGDEALTEYYPEDVRVLLNRWCEEAFQVDYNRVILLFCVLSLISCDCAYHITNILEMLIV